ncbi:hypothetical protein X739_33670 [Mesorhizobium sp. LNHC220B00]|nr:hypothetical protein X739_33670 [Mesorhizobium sp. LNHC220B00]
MPALIDQHCAFAADRFAHQRHGPLRNVERRRVELDEFQIGEFCTGACGERQAVPE